MAKLVNVTFSITKGYLRITLPKKVSTRNYLQIRNRIESELEKKADKVMIDLSKVSVMESLFIGLLLHTRRIIKSNEGVLYLVNASEKCSERLHGLFLDTIFTICKDEKQVYSKKNS